jgi:ubiquitin-conjugating enzyme E2 C
MQLMTSPAPGVSAFPSADGNLLSWRATIEGPADTPYAGLTFKLSFEFPSNYASASTFSRTSGPPPTTPRRCS